MQSLLPNLNNEAPTNLDSQVPTQNINNQLPSDKAPTPATKLWMIKNRSQPTNNQPWWKHWRSELYNAFANSFPLQLPWGGNYQPVVFLSSYVRESPILIVIKFHGWTTSPSFPRQFISADVENFMREAMVDPSKFKFPQPPYRLETPLVDVEIDPHMRGLNVYVYQIALIRDSFCTLYHQVERILQTKGCPSDPATKPQKESKP